ncbi:DNA mismatch repair protein MutS [Bacillus lacus]|uniref:DNA mismatch repair protein MutS n=1 Tax=Metabacillus lacus TaxID=1983721 RepID=A0A7X2IVU8_9BACI|nr:DNA mismatch repair protein MutS [Metabacillus lacus]MRX70680.1 DNA mismatch repair protein MutS [Metabacillus lacus]
MSGYTPMIQQYLSIKAEYQDAFLFFRLGDFYEMFFDDALKASKELEITLTSRDGGSQDRIPMCGVPYHAAAAYIERLIEKGYKVAICEQTEDPKQAKGVVKREVVQLITPGTVMEGKSLKENENNYLSSLEREEKHFALALTDLTTGENTVVKLASIDETVTEIYAVGAKEIVISSGFSDIILEQLQKRCAVAVSVSDEDELTEEIISYAEHISDPLLRKAFSRLYHYLKKTQMRNLQHLQKVKEYKLQQHMKIDLYSKRNLELTETIRSKDKKGSLLWLLDETKTSMGARMLKQWIDKPLLDPVEIDKRLNTVETFMNSYFEKEDLREKLKEVYDLERLAGRVAFGNVNARDLTQLRRSLEQIPSIRELVGSLKHPDAARHAEKLDPCEELTVLLSDALAEHPPISIKEGNIIRDGFDEQLDIYRNASKNGKTWMVQLEQRERQSTGIKSLKIGYNKVFGYYIEVSRANLPHLPEGRYERKQTLANAERFITPELKEKEALILEAEEKMAELEHQLFLQLREKVKTFISRLQSLAKTISELDVLQCFATVSDKRHYCKPQFTADEIRLIDGRHPVVEKVMDSQEYVPNNCLMNAERNLLLITGPNMSGKSTYMRQIALTAILAQIGCFVPAKEAYLPVFDQIFTRIGAADDLISGQSTFMVEMLEARNALAHATSRSLILFDEIGRGTSTYDGMALAQAIIEYVHKEIGAKTLFSTHYHELTILEKKLSGLENVHVKAVEDQGKVVFLHKVDRGAADKSYGIHVAELAELPEQLIQRAKKLLSKFEAAGASITREQSDVSAPQTIYPEKEQLSFFHEEEGKQEKAPSKKEMQLLKEIRELNILEMNPLEAMNELYRIQKKLKK